MKEHRQEVRLEGRSVVAVVAESGLDVGGRLLSWLDVDDVVEGDHRVRLVLADGAAIDLSHLGSTHDRFMTALRAARRRVRLPALTIADGDPIVEFVSRAPSGASDVLLFTDVLVIEPRTGSPAAVPLSLVTDVSRTGHSFRVSARGMAPVEVGMLGARTDEFADQLEQAMSAHRLAAAAGRASIDAALDGLDLVDGWAVSAVGSPHAWGTLRSVAGRGPRAAELQLLEDLSGPHLRLGVTSSGRDVMVFAIAPVGSRVAVESASADDRATFVFETDDVDALNLWLVSTRFRREALSLPEQDLGRWAVAVRTWPPVQAARSALRSRIVHSATWVDEVSKALTR